MIPRRRRRPDPEPMLRWEGKDAVVSYGGLDFKQHKDSTNTLSVTCTSCSAKKGGLSGAELKAFYVEHYNLHVPPPAPVDQLLEVDFDRLVADQRTLGRDELAVIRLVTDGLLAGKPVYGELDVAADSRSFKREGFDEGRDQLIYDAADLLRRLRAGALS